MCPLSIHLILVAKAGGWKTTSFIMAMRRVKIMNAGTWMSSPVLCCALNDHLLFSSLFFLKVMPICQSGAALHGISNPLPREAYNAAYARYVRLEETRQKMFPRTKMAPFLPARLWPVGDSEFLPSRLWLRILTRDTLVFTLLGQEYLDISDRKVCHKDHFGRLSSCKTGVYLRQVNECIEI